MPHDDVTIKLRSNVLEEKLIQPSTLENIDRALFEYIDSEFDISCDTNKGFKKAPVVWLSAERAFQIKNNKEIQTIIKRLEIIKKNSKGPSLEELIKKLDKQPNNIIIIIETADKFFSNNEYDNAFKLLLEKYPKNKEKIKEKILEFFNALGHSHDSTIVYRKKFSQIMFS